MPSRSRPFLAILYALLLLFCITSFTFKVQREKGKSDYRGEVHAAHRILGNESNRILQFLRFHHVWECVLTVANPDSPNLFIAPSLSPSQKPSPPSITALPTLSPTMFRVTNTILPEDGATNDHFGSSVAIFADKVLIGAIHDIDELTESGTAYLFDSEGEFISKIIPHDGSENDEFGFSVDLSASYIVVGARFDDDNGDDSGSAYLYDTSGNFIAKLLAPDGDDNDYFGHSVGISENNIVVGAYGDGDKGEWSGSAYLFNTQGTFVSKLNAPDGVSDELFGWDVAISNTTIVITSPWNNNQNGNFSGSAYMFDTEGNFISKLLDPDGATGDRFGYSVAIFSENIVLGSPNNDENGDNSGAAFLFNSSGTLITKLLAPNGMPGDRFGNTVALSDDFIIISAPNHEESQSVGSIYIYHVTGIYQEHIAISNSTSDIRFASSVAVFGSDIVVGADSHENGEGSGSVYIIN